MRNFFISYNKADGTWAEWIAWQLEEAGYTTILQAWDFRPAENFVIKMNDAIRNSERTVAVLSPDYLSAVFTLPEWAAAFAQDPISDKGVLLPVRVRECDLTGLFNQIIYIDLVGKDEVEAKMALLSGIRRERAKPLTKPEFPGSVRRSVSEHPLFPGISTRSTETVAKEEKAPEYGEPTEAEMKEALLNAMEKRGGQRKPHDTIVFENIIAGMTIKIERFEKLGCKLADSGTGYVCTYIITTSQTYHSNDETNRSDQQAEAWNMILGRLGDNVGTETVIGKFVPGSEGWIVFQD